MLPAGKTLDFDQLLPTNRTYVTYEGSLTTPPCSEQVLWHLMLHPVKMSRAQWSAFRHATGDSNCTETAPIVPAKNSVPAATAGRKLRSSDPGPNPVEVTEPAYTCAKLGAGWNSRVVQKVNDRLIKTHTDSTIKIEPRRPAPSAAKPPPKLPAKVASSPKPRSPPVAKKAAAPPAKRNSTVSNTFVKSP